MRAGMMKLQDAVESDDLIGTGFSHASFIRRPSFWGLPTPLLIWAGGRIAMDRKRIPLTPNAAFFRRLRTLRYMTCYT
jgi:hypothetical protein